MTKRLLRIEQPAIDLIDRRYVPKERLTPEQLQPFHDEAVAIAAAICTVKRHKERTPISPYGMSGRHQTYTFALSPPVPYHLDNGEHIKLGLRYSTHCYGDDPADLQDPSTKVVELGMIYAPKKNQKVDRHDITVIGALNDNYFDSASEYALGQYPGDRGSRWGTYNTNNPKDLESFMQGVRYMGRWLGV